MGIGIAGWFEGPGIESRLVFRGFIDLYVRCSILGGIWHLVFSLGGDIRLAQVRVDGPGVCEDRCYKFPLRSLV